MYPLFWSKSCELAQIIQQKLQDGQLIDVMDSANRATLDIIGSAAMVQEFHAVENSDSGQCQNYCTVAVANWVVLLLSMLNTLLPD